MEARIRLLRVLASALAGALCGLSALALVALPVFDTRPSMLYGGGDWRVEVLYWATLGAAHALASVFATTLVDEPVARRWKGAGVLGAFASLPLCVGGGLYLASAVDSIGIAVALCAAPVVFGGVWGCVYRAARGQWSLGFTIAGAALLPACLILADRFKYVVLLTILNALLVAWPKRHSLPGAFPATVA